MYVLFKLNDNKALGIFNEIKPFTRGIYLDNPELIYKVNQVNTIEETDLYIDRFGVISNKKTKTSQKYKNIKSEEKNIYLIHSPQEFIYEEILEYRKKELLNDTKFTQCMLIESFFEQFIDIDSCKNIQYDDNNIILNANSILSLKAIKLKTDSNIQIITKSNSDQYTLYVKNGNGNFRKNKGIIKENSGKINIELKNETDTQIIIDSIALLF